MAVEIKEVPGLWLIENVISKEDQKQILRSLITNTGSECRQIHPAKEFGWSFIKGLLSKWCSSKDYIPMPIWVKTIWEKIIKIPEINKIIGNVEIVDNILINIYEKGDSLIPHVDDINFWDDFVLGLSLGSDIIIDFAKIDSNETHPIFIPAKSVYILTKDARYSYKHSIKVQEFNNIRRVSITFRTISDKFLSQNERNKIKSKFL